MLPYDPIKDFKPISLLAKVPSLYLVPQTDAAIAAGSTPAEFAALIATERERWKPVLARAKVKPD